MSGNLLLFGRLSDDGIRRIILFDLLTRESQVLDHIQGRGAFLAPGQINGDWASWTKCRAVGPCDAIRYNIPNRERIAIANPGREQRATSIGPDGTLYFARARSVCGSSVRLMSVTVDGTETELWRLPSGDDIGTTHVYVDGGGGTSLYFDHYDCDQAAVSDVWEIVEPGTAPTTSPSPGSTGPPSSPSPSPSPTTSPSPTGETGPTGPTGPSPSPT
jgi:hypothetical protein